MFNYAGWRNACNYIFIVFAAIFIVTRLVIFPFRYKKAHFKNCFNVIYNWLLFNLYCPHSLCCRIIYCTWVYPVTIYEPFFGYYFFNGLLMVLQCLHVFWAVLIIRIAVRFLTNNVSTQRNVMQDSVCLTMKNKQDMQNNLNMYGFPLKNVQLKHLKHEKKCR